MGMGTNNMGWRGQYRWKIQLCSQYVAFGDHICVDRNLSRQIYKNDELIRCLPDIPILPAYAMLPGQTIIL